MRDVAQNHSNNIRISDTFQPSARAVEQFACWRDASINSFVEDSASKWSADTRLTNQAIGDICIDTGVGDESYQALHMAIVLSSRMMRRSWLRQQET